MFVDFDTKADDETYEDARVEAFQKQLDSINSLAYKKADTLYPFNPNYLTDFKGYQLGMSMEEIDKLLAYRSNQKWVNSAKEFQEVTGVSDSLLSKISPSFKFPEWAEKANKTSVQKSNELPEVVLDLNTATAEDLKKINGVGDVLSERIIKYRNSIGGFLDLIQLQDVYGLSPEVISRIVHRFKLLSRPDRTIKNINLVSEAELAEIPYFNPSIAKKIISYRKLHQGISSVDEMIEIDGFPYDKIDRIKLYLAFN